MFKFSGSTSMGTGLAFWYITEKYVAIFVIAGISTSSSFWMSKLNKARCKAVVPLETVIPYLQSQIFEKFFSNLGRYSP